MIPLTETGNLGDSLEPGKIFSFWKWEILSSVSTILHLGRERGMWVECHKHKNNLRGNSDEKTAKGPVLRNSQEGFWLTNDLCRRDILISINVINLKHKDHMTRGESNGITGESNGISPCVSQKLSCSAKATETAPKKLPLRPLYCFPDLLPTREIPCWTHNCQAEEKKILTTP